MSREITVALPRPHYKQSRIVTDPAKRIIIRAGRRGGKTVAAAMIAIRAFLDGRRVLYATPTLEQIDRFWFTCKVALTNALDAGIFQKNEVRHIIERSMTDNRIRAKTAWNANTLRGDYADVLILDEFQMMKEEAWEAVGLPMLIDNNGTGILIYTPPSLEAVSRSRAKDSMYAAKLFKKALADKTGRWSAYTFTSYDNPYISREAIDALADDMSAVTYRMEILAEDVDESPGALWTREIVERNRIDKAPPLDIVIIGVDPSETSTGDETGIVAVGRAGNNYYILGDYSLQGSPAAWANQTKKSFFAHEADYVVAESNAGGEMVKSVINQADSEIPVKLVFASSSKQTRAAPVSTLTEKNRVKFVGNFYKLEDELCLWIPGMKSPNRLDAMVHAVNYLSGRGNMDNKIASSYQG